MRTRRDNGADAGAGRVAVVLKGYPRLSETFVAQELLGLEARGHTIDIHSLRHPYDPTTHPIHDEIAAAVSYLPEYLWRAPMRVLRGWWAARKLPGYSIGPCQGYLDHTGLGETREDQRRGMDNHLHRLRC